nr:ATP-binding protein [Romboutsia sp. 13368]
MLKDNEAIPCTCKALREAEEILLSSGISEEFRRKNFDNFDYSYSMEVCEAFSKAKEYAKNFDINLKDNSSIIFVGQVGGGKSHLSMAIANSLMKNGVGVLYMSYRDSIISLKQNMMDEEYYRKAIGRFKNAKVLLIDDLFKGSISGSDVNIMFEIINFRYLNSLPVIVSCEKSIDEIMKIDEAIGSRLYEMSNGYVVSLSGRRLNYRMYKRS